MFGSRSNRKKAIGWLGAVGWLCTLTVQAQEIRNCGYTHYNPPNASQLQAFEQWLDQKITAKSAKNIPPHQEAVYVLPVVVHIVHNGEAVGTGTNISDAQILSQIQVLNEDFRRKSGTPGFNTVAVGADVGIEFVLASFDPDGLPTTGIRRVQGSKNAWQIADDAQLKAQSYWNSSQYINIWVCNLQGLLGYARLPESNILAGVPVTPQNPLLDGIVIGFQQFGRVGNVRNPFNQGRSLTHEMGHYLGLRHIWGDRSNCTGTDFCDDTPPATDPNYGCPAIARAICNPARPEMFQNYMDYTNDACMNLFTQDQRLRMRTVVENSPRRQSLLSSLAFLPSISNGNDAGIEQILQAQTNECVSEVVPLIRLRNYGNKTLRKVTIQYQLANAPAQQVVWTGSLPTLGTTNFSLPAFINPAGRRNLRISTTLPNDSADVNQANDTREISLNTLVPAQLPQAFDPNNLTSLAALPTGWAILNPDESFTWELATLPDRKALNLNFFNYRNIGTEDWLISPPIDLRQSQSPVLQFEYAYAAYQNSDNTNPQDKLQIRLSADCGLRFDTVLFQAAGVILATTLTQVKQAWTPSSPNDWRTVQLDLTPFAGNSYIQVAFVGVNDFGSNLYLGKISLKDSSFAQNTAQYFSIFPNPSSNGQFSVAFNLPQPEDVVVQLATPDGKLLWEQTLPQTQRQIYPFLLARKPTGVALLTVKGKTFRQTKRVLFP